MKLMVREAAASDYESLCVLFDEVDALHRENLPRIFQKPEGAVRERETILGLIRNEATGFFVAQVGDQLVGMIIVILKEPPDFPLFVQRRYAVVDNLVVKRTFQRTGIGRALMEKASEWAAAQGAESIELNVWEFNQDAIEFYRTLGYETASRKMNRQL